MSINKRSIVDNVVAGFLIAVGIYIIFDSIVIWGNSWLKIFIIIAAVIAGLGGLTVRGKIKKFLKFFIVGVMIFAITFAYVENYMFSNVGHPSTYTVSEPMVTLSFQGLLNTSLTQIVQNITQSSTFNLLKFEYGKISLNYLEFVTALGSYGGSIEAVLFTENSKDGFGFSSNDGSQYKITRGINQDRAIYYYREITQETLTTIDSLGISWFYNRCVEIAQNRTNDLSSIDLLVLTIGYDEDINYQGITVSVRGYHQFSMSDIRNIFFAFFQPDGTLLSI